MKWLRRLFEPSLADFAAADRKCRAMAQDRKDLHELRQIAAEKLGRWNWRFDIDPPPNPKMDTVVADTVAKMRAPFADRPPRSIPAKRKRP